MPSPFGVELDELHVQRCPLLASCGKFLEMPDHRLFTTERVENALDHHLCFFGALRFTPAFGTPKRDHLPLDHMGAEVLDDRAGTAPNPRPSSFFHKTFFGSIFIHATILPLSETHVKIVRQLHLKRGKDSLKPVSTHNP